MLSISAAETPYLHLVSTASLRAPLPSCAAYSVVSCSSSSCDPRGLDPGSRGNLCARPAVFATLRLVPRESAGMVVREKCSRRCSRMKLRNAADERLSLAKPLPDLVTGRATATDLTQPSPLHGLRAPFSRVRVYMTEPHTEIMASFASECIT
jgi:hypothetical protein